MNNTQRKYLRVAIDKAERAHRSAIYDRRKAKDPADIARYRRLVRQHDRRESAKSSRILGRLATQRARIERAMAFETPERALLLVEQFAKWRPAKP